ncbi:MAG TPA: signal peptidase II [Actinomycetota bacterium]|nr:signal peptidase II [Actinomycetota bacterium]
MVPASDADARSLQPGCGPCPMSRYARIASAARSVSGDGSPRATTENGSPRATTAGGLNKRGGPYRLLVPVASLAVVLDQVTKELALDGLRDGPIDLVPGAVTLRLAFNSGGVFGLGQGFPLFFLAATVVIIVAVLVWTRGVEDARVAAALGLIVGGGTGNLLDRIVRDYGGRVVDFVDLHVWPVFNVADSCIVVGVALVLLFGARARPAG